MTLAPTPARSGNPGIVPPWLQRPVSPAPGTDATAPAPAPKPEPTTSSVQDAHAGRDALTFVPVPGGVVVVDLPEGGERGVPSLPGRQFRSAPSQGTTVAREQQRLEQTVAAIQHKYSELGVKDSEGNDPVVAKFEPRYPNASYAPEGVPEMGTPPDSITVGVDPRDHTPFTSAVDVVAHELGHRIIDHMTHGGLEMSPLSEDVAVHESLADTFASLVDDDDWVIGDTLVEPIRDMKHPERLGHPGNVADLKSVLAPGSEFMVPVGRDRRTGEVVTAPDWHVVAGIPNKAASIIGDELGRDKLGQIYFKAVRENVRGGQEIEGLAVAVMKSARDLFGANSREFQVTKDAWDAVGVLELVRQQAANGRR
jgi:hypothetical protein